MKWINTKTGHACPVNDKGQCLDLLPGHKHHSLRADETPAAPYTGPQRDGNLGEVIDRRVQVYGDPVVSFTEIATMWSVLFDVEIPAWKVPIAQALMKVVRMKNSPDYSDHSDDIDGYLDIFRKVIGPDMIQARTVNEYIEKKWPTRNVAQDFGIVGVQLPDQVADEYVGATEESCCFAWTSTGGKGHNLSCPTLKLP